MTKLFDRAFEVDAILIGTPETGQVLIAAGGVLPHIALGEAPVNSVYFRNTGEVFKNLGIGDQEADWNVGKFVPTAVEIQQAAGGGAAQGHIHVRLEDASLGVIELQSGVLPIRLDASSVGEIELV